MGRIEEVRKAMVAAMKAGDKERKASLSMLLSALKAKQIDKPGHAELTEAEENEVVLKEIRQTQETIDTTPADRTDILDECSHRIAVYKEFAPVMLDEEGIKKEIAAVLEELGIENPTVKDKGKIMKPLMARVKGKADGKLVNKVLSSML